MLDDYLGQTGLSIEEISKAQFMEQCGLSGQYDNAVDSVLALRLNEMQATLQLQTKKPALAGLKGYVMENKNHVNDTTGKLKVPAQEERHAPAFKKAPKKD